MGEHRSPGLTPGLRIGLTGGIGSGKSTVARRLAALGALVVDTDAVAHALTAPGGAAVLAIAAAFGPDMIAADGAMDRARMRALVFGQPAQRQRLEAILHPMIGEATRAQASRARAGQAIVFDVPLLTESGTWRARVDRVLVVDCAEATQVARVVQRSGWTADAVERTIAQQASRAQRRAIADAVIVNEDLELAQLDAEVDALWGHWVAK
ncbi:dephospho-CoA kinase [Scleromatobacter humisilvae]|uniref:Dephospho-CoA kinase n=1 Tax=Scleromatobacter humisilvae TaxID=2897159 RepID=A0A9X1YK86_9BURK|nr:dephospho-CoA kinase [Scleromatobacter humisilvae]MCK9688044.1 dephospho-CoA kinase [Scleromatobacter humisilvae]